MTFLSKAINFKDMAMILIIMNLFMIRICIPKSSCLINWAVLFRIRPFDKITIFDFEIEWRYKYEMDFWLVRMFKYNFFWCFSPCVHVCIFLHEHIVYHGHIIESSLAGLAERIKAIDKTRWCLLRFQSDKISYKGFWWNFKRMV